MKMPDRGDLDAALARFHAKGLTPVLSTNGSIPDADIDVTRGPRVRGEAVPILDVQITPAGLAKLEAAT
jgi:hypothetical protein